MRCQKRWYICLQWKYELRQLTSHRWELCPVIDPEVLDFQSPRFPSFPYIFLPIQRLPMVCHRTVQAHISRLLFRFHQASFGHDSQTPAESVSNSSICSSKSDNVISELPDDWDSSADNSEVDILLRNKIKLEILIAFFEMQAKIIVIQRVPFSL